MIHRKDAESAKSFSLPFARRRDLLSDWCEAWWKGRSLQMKKGNKNTLFASFATLR